MTVQRHIIRKQTLEVSMEEATDAFAFKEQLSLFCTNMLLPAIEKVFDERAPAGKVFKADRIEIDAGELPADNWEKVLCEKVVEQLGALFSPSGTSTLAAGTAKTSAPVNELSVEDNAGNFILHFLRTGLMPWNSTIQRKAELQLLMEAAVSRDAFLKQLIYLLNTEPQVLKRLIRQFDEPVLDSILEMLGIKKICLVRLKKFAITLFEKIQLIKTERRMLQYSAFFESALVKENNLNSSKHFSFVENVNPIIFKSITKEQLVKIIKILAAGVSVSEHSTEHFAEDQFNIVSGQDINIQQEPISENRVASDRDKEQEYFITNAGLVLFHPFLSSLFENIGYTHKHVWLSEEVQQRALVLTQYLVTGREDSPEFELLLNKILLGYPIADTLAGDIVLSEFEKKEAHDLLRAVIKHWAALKNTSIEGLQTTFLQREGKIWFKDSTCYVKVAQRTADILLNRIPWGISIIKTPWMESMMQVEWN